MQPSRTPACAPPPLRYAAPVAARPPGSAAQGAGEPLRQTILAGAVLAIALACPGFAPSAAENGAAAVRTARASAADRALVASIQELLTALGYDAGPADGVAGQRTRRAIARFQASAGMAADGKPSEALYARLTQALNQGVPEPAPAPAVAPTVELVADTAPAAGRPLPIAATALPLAGADAAGQSPQGARWRITDADGASVELEFEPGGRVAGNATARFWRWEQRGESVRIVYDNEWGGWVVRTGRLDGGRIAGTAEGAGGRRWDWSAERLPGRAGSAAWQAAR